MSRGRALLAALLACSCVYDLDSVPLRTDGVLHDSCRETLLIDRGRDLKGCASCPPKSRCNTEGICIDGCTIVPTCQSRQCGGDGCMGLCGKCVEGQTCTLFKCQADCGFSFRLTVPSLVNDVVIDSWTAMHSHCARGVTQTFIGNFYVSGMLDGQALGLVSILFKWIDQPLAPNTTYILTLAAVQPEIVVQIEKHSAELDGLYTSRELTAQVKMKTGSFSHVPGGSFEVQLLPGSEIVGKGGKRMTITGRTSGRFLDDSVP